MCAPLGPPGWPNIVVPMGNNLVLKVGIEVRLHAGLWIFLSWPIFWCAASCEGGSGVVVYAVGCDAHMDGEAIYLVPGKTRGVV
ncbi:hypothetical protein Lalb_Chr10g0106691 [Lupinus albus]|uniref:Uncharacterized protein n=1 Tax=Lupinus albus TaxID=3870 RepID=A0A6A4PX41_LUPAL|nr:hypothetical protein Lalb_Chr10g0106691 [Lupinus albus]